MSGCDIAMALIQVQHNKRPDNFRYNLRSPRGFKRDQIERRRFILSGYPVETFKLPNSVYGGQETQHYLYSDSCDGVYALGETKEGHMVASY